MLEKLQLGIQRIKNLDFQSVLIVIIIAFFLQIVCLLFKASFNLGIIYCPLIYLYKKNINTKFIAQKKYDILFVHLFFSLITILFIAFVNSVNLTHVAHIIFLSVYLLLIRREIHIQTEVSNFSNSKNIVSLYNYFTTLSIIIFVIDLFEKNVRKVFGFDLSLMFIGILLICIVFSVIFLFTLREEIKKDENESDFEEDLKISLSSSYESPLAQNIIHFFETQDVYLNPNFTLKNLSDILEVSRVSVSEVMNKEMKYGFYNIMAKYRIEHAKKIILENDNLTIEALVVQCGFNSKSSFNKYFKIFAGQLPSSFRKNHRDKLNYDS